LAISLSYTTPSQTLDRVECHLAGTFDCGQAYVALSRASSLQVISLDQLNVKDPLKPC
jgi:hypothetical protein